MKRLIDHRSATTGARLRNFMRLAARSSEAVTWPQARQRDRLPDTGSRRLAQYLRIDRDRQV